MIKLRSSNEQMFGASMLSLVYAHDLAQDYGLHTAINRKAFPLYQLRRQPRWQPNRHQRKHGLANGYSFAQRRAA